MCSVQRNERLICLGHGARPRRRVWNGAGKRVREWTIGGLYPKSNEKAVNHSSREVNRPVFRKVKSGAD